jgi:hypothetical protein
VPVGALLVGTVVSFVVAYASIAWLLRFVAGHKITLFVPYRVALGLVLVVLLATGTITATYGGDWPGGSCGQRQRTKRIGSTTVPFSRTSKCRCGPVA